MMQKAASSHDDLPDELARLEPGQSYVACAFYTPNYLPQVLSLKRSLEEHGIGFYLKRYERLATWEATTRLKPQFIVHCIDRFPGKDILYLDADAVVRRPLDFFDGLEADVSLLFHPMKIGRTHCLRLSGGTVFVRNTEGGRKFARAWAAQEEKCGPLTLDEDMIYMAFSELEGVTIAVLPQTYYKIFDRPGSEPVIEHFQASRGQFKWRRLIRKARRVGTGVAVVAGALLAWWLSKHLSWH